MGTAVADGRHDFDFLFGQWNVRNQRLRHPLSGSTEWYEFSSTVTEMPLLGGLANLEQYDALEAGDRSIHAVAMRLYDVASHRWSIYWGTAGQGAFETPVIGRFEDGVGSFYNREQFEGRDVVVRFTWSQIDANHCRWEQAFSADDGRSWEVNWTMDFTRAEASAGAVQK
jgi:hypothetical protein